MTLIPASTKSSFRRGDQGIGVWSLQNALNDVQIRVVCDGDFGPATEQAVRDFQNRTGITVDGIAGPGTQRELAKRIVRIAELAEATPLWLLAGFAEGEGGWLLAAINRTVEGGVDCGLFQRRVYEADYGNLDVVHRAFDTSYQADLLAKSLVNLRSIFIARAGTNDGGLMPAREKAWRLAALNHNYPSGADRLSRTPLRQLSPYWVTPQSWVTEFGYRFPDSRPVRTPLEWCHLYAGVLGAGTYGTSGSVTKRVTTWP